MTAHHVQPPAFAPLVPACRTYGIGKTRAHELAADGTLETFKLGARRFVVLESLRTLPQRIAANAQTVH